MPSSGKARVRLLEVPAEQAPARALPSHHGEERREEARRERRDEPLQAQRRGERAGVGGGEVAVRGERVLAGRLAAEHGADLPPARDAEVERGADPLAGEGEAVAGAVADE